MSDLTDLLPEPGNRQVRPMSLSGGSCVTPSEAAYLLRLVGTYDVSGPSRELAKHLVDLTPMERFYRAVQVTMFLLDEEPHTDIPPPYLSAEEQFLIEELSLVNLPTEGQRVAVGLLYVAERSAVVRFMGRTISNIHKETA